MPATDYVGKEPLTVQHLKLPKSVVTAVKIAAEIEGRQMGWKYRDILSRWAGEFTDKLAREKARQKAARKKVVN